MTPVGKTFSGTLTKQKCFASQLFALTASVQPREDVLSIRKDHKELELDLLVFLRLPVEPYHIAAVVGVVLFHVARKRVGFIKAQMRRHLQTGKVTVRAVSVGSKVAVEHVNQY